MPVLFTKTDKALLDRAARHLDGQAIALKWEEQAEPTARRLAKDQFDRHARDARDLRALAKRLLKAAVLVETKPAEACKVCHGTDGQHADACPEVAARQPINADTVTVCPTCKGVDGHEDFCPGNAASQSSVIA